MKNPVRLKFLKIAVCAGLIGGIFFSFELWFPIARTFPRVPFVFESPVWFDRLLAIILIVSLISAIFFERLKVFLIMAIASLILLIFFDQMRLQPWVYQYLLLLIVFALTKKDGNLTLGLAQIIIAALYFWSGLQKLNYTFSHETLPLLLAPIQNLFPSIQPPLVFLGIAIALIETLIGGGLSFRKTRNLAVCSAVAMHTTILILLIFKGFNSIVWIWNAALITLVITAFWKSEISIPQILKTTFNLKEKIVLTIVAASILLPVLSFFGFWDLYLSGALYSGNTEIAVMRIGKETLENLPPKARQSVFQTQSTSEKILPFFEWSIAELNVPAYPEQRISKEIARELCKSANNKSKIELIIRERPAILDGRCKVTRISCAEL